MESGGDEGLLDVKEKQSQPARPAYRPPMDQALDVIPRCKRSTLRHRNDMRFELAGWASAVLGREASAGSCTELEQFIRQPNVHWCHPHGSGVHRSMISDLSRVPVSTLLAAYANYSCDSQTKGQLTKHRRAFPSFLLDKLSHCSSLLRVCSIFPCCAISRSVKITTIIEFVQRSHFHIKPGRMLQTLPRTEGTPKPMIRRMCDIVPSF